MPQKMTFGEARQRFSDLSFHHDWNDETAVFVKSSVDDVFGSEVAGLDALRASDQIRIAQVICHGACGGQYVIVLEAIESRTPDVQFFERFGTQLAEMHRINQADQFGFHDDNFIGKTRQLNVWSSDWVEFWATSRLGFQLKLARENGFKGEVQRLGQLLLGKLGSLIGGLDEPPCLVHGDLWSGNWLCDQQGRPTLIDPAVYFANREAEFGMTTLFGGLPQAFYDAYNEAWPMATGWEERVSIYRLYHLLNHLNLFGSSYLPECLGILKRFA